MRLNYALRQTNGALTGNLGWLFTMYYLHCDHLLRCYPSIKLLLTETGIKSNSTLLKYRKKLIEMKALVIVPFDKRITNKETELPVRQFVYQITGVMVLPDNRIIPTVHIDTPESLQSHIQILKELDFDTDLISQAHHEVTKTVTLKLQKLDVTEIDTKVVHIKDKEIQEAAMRAPAREDISDDDFAKILTLFDSTSFMTSTTLGLLKEDANTYSFQEWSDAIDVLKQRQTEQSIGLPYHYLLKILEGKAKDRALEPQFPNYQPIPDFSIASPEVLEANRKLFAEARDEMKKASGQ